MATQAATQATRAVSGLWHAYLDATRGLSAERYAEVEPWAWKRLTTSLRRLGITMRESDGG